MKIRERFPRAVRTIENEWIELADGTRLAARLWLPEDALERPVPAIVEYLPYRKRDGTRERDEPMHRWFAGHGFAALRVDLRGCGDSEGLLLDEYLPQEQADGVEVIRWVARQPWCSGAVGMLGKSWGGFNALQIAALRPPALKAVISVCAADDRYADDAHYMGGCLLCENMTWGAVLFTLNARAPDPALVGPSWRATWLARLERNPLFPAVWLAHPLRDGYWKQGSVGEDFGAIECPVYAIGGWADGYSNSVPRVLAGLRTPRKGLVGPWAHRYPHNGVPGPAIGFLQEARRWFERWLREERNGVEDEPVYRVWLQESERPHASFADRAGRWVAEEAWPSARIEPRAWRLASDGELRGDDAPLGDEERAPLSIRSPQTVGACAGSWCAFGFDGELPGDQRPDDAGSLCFDSAPLAERLEILGAPELELELASDRPQALVAARLCEVLPDGTSARVSYGLLDLTHRDGHERCEPLVPGGRLRARVRLNDVAHAFAPGSRLRLALSTSYWPIVWPSPEPATLSVFPAGARLTLPVRPPHPADAALAPFEPPEAGPSPSTLDLHPGGVARRTWVDAATGEHVLEVVIDLADDGEPALTRLEDIDLETGHAIVETFRIHPDDPASASLAIHHRVRTRRGAWSTRVETALELRADASAFHLSARLEALEDERPVFARAWVEALPRTPRAAGHGA